MRTVRYLAHALIAAASLGAVGCGSDQLHDGDHAANYERVFDGPVPSTVEVVNSVVREYRGGSCGGPTDDWEFEIIAPISWIETKSEEMYLASVYPERPEMADALAERLEHRWQAWYAPGTIDDYELFFLRPTSIPYVHLLVEKLPQEDGRYRLFISKH